MRSLYRRLFSDILKNNQKNQTSPRCSRPRSIAQPIHHSTRPLERARAGTYTQTLLTYCLTYNVRYTPPRPRFSYTRKRPRSRRRPLHYRCLYHAGAVRAKVRKSIYCISPAWAFLVMRGGKKLGTFPVLKFDDKFMHCNQRATTNTRAGCVVHVFTILGSGACTRAFSFLRRSIFKS